MSFDVKMRIIFKDKEELILQLWSRSEFQRIQDELNKYYIKDFRFLWHYNYCINKDEIKYIEFINNCEEE